MDGLTISGRFVSVEQRDRNGKSTWTATVLADGKTFYVRATSPVFAGLQFGDPVTWPVRVSVYNGRFYLWHVS